MVDPLRLLLVTAVLAGSLPAGQAPAWRHLKLGLSADEATSLLGEPLQRVKGRGFETWTYDGGAEVLFYAKGSVIGWTAPAAIASEMRSRDVWTANPGESYAAVLRSVPPPATAKAAASRAAKSAPPGDRSFERHLTR